MEDNQGSANYYVTLLAGCVGLLLWFGAGNNLSAATSNNSSNNTPPVAQNITASTPINTSKLITLKGSDANGDPLRYSIVTPPASGKVVPVQPDTTTSDQTDSLYPNYTFTPATGFSGQVTFQYGVSDKFVRTTATVTITVQANKPPVLEITDNQLDIESNEAIFYTIQASDPDGSSVQITALNLPVGAKLVEDKREANRTISTFSWSPKNQQIGNYKITFQSSDGIALSSKDLLIKVQPRNLVIDREKKLAMLHPTVENDGGQGGGFVPASVPPATCPFDYRDPWVVTNADTSLSAAPSTSSPVMRDFPAGTPVQLLEEKVQVRGDWWWEVAVYNVDDFVGNTLFGWIREDILEPKLRTYKFCISDTVRLTSPVYWEYNGRELIPTGEVGTIVQGPILAWGLDKWVVDFNNADYNHMVDWISEWDLELIPVPNAPTLSSATPTSISQINLTWVDNSSNEDGFRVRRAPSNNPDVFTGAGTLPAGSTTFTDSGLTPNKWYLYEIDAFNNLSGTSPPSNARVAKTWANTLPIAVPTDPAAVASSSRVRLTWTDDSSNEDGFKIERRLGTSGVWQEVATVPTRLPFFIFFLNTFSYYDSTGITANTLYNYRIRAYNSAGASSYTAVLSARTTLPGQDVLATPTNLVASLIPATELDPESISLTWMDNSTNEDGFVVERSWDGTTWTEWDFSGPNTNSLIVQWPEETTLFYYRIYADSNILTDSGYSNTASIRTHLLPPSDLEATVSSASEIELSWWNHSLLANGYHIQRSPNGTTGWVDVGSIPNDSFFTDTGLRQNTLYYYRVYAVADNGGTSVYSNVASDRTSILAPPDQLTAESLSSSEIMLTWYDNSFDESGFKIQRSPNGSSGWVEVGSVAEDETSFTNTGLLQNTLYYYRVYAYHTTAGNSAYSNVASTRTSIIDPPSDLDANAVSSNQIELAWTDNSGDEDGFKIERSPNGSTGWTLIGTVDADISDYTNSGLAGNTTYYYRVFAFNSASGNSSYSNISSARTSLAPAAAPTNLVATPISSTQINLTWQDNSNDENGFEIEFSFDGENWFLGDSVDTNVRQFSHTDLDEFVVYYYRVRAVNANGESAYSNTVHTKPLASSLPEAPSDLSANVLSTTEIELNWNNNAENYDGFKVERKIGTAGTWQLITTTDDLTYLDQGLQESTKYAYRVLAFNNRGNSPYSNVVDTKTLTTPGTVQWGKGIGGPLADEGLDIAVDSAGNQVIVGHFNGTVDFGGQSLASMSPDDIFLAKYNSSGNLAWVNRIGNFSDYDIADIAISSSGDIAVTGQDKNSMALFVNKYSSGGALSWTRVYANAVDDESIGHGVAFDSVGNVVVAGAYSQASNGCSDVLLTKYLSAGNPAWASAIRFKHPSSPECAPSNVGLDVAIDTSNNILLTGQISYQDTTNQVYHDDLFVAKYPAAGGTRTWLRTIEEPDFGFAIGEKIAINRSDNSIVVLGSFSFGSFLKKYTSSGSASWTSDISLYATQVFDMVVDASGNVLLTWEGVNGVFAKFDAEGNLSWELSMETPSSLDTIQLGVDGMGYSYLTGKFSETFTAGSNDLTSHGDTDAFLLKVSP